MDFALNRPQGFEGAGDKYLLDIAARLTALLIEVQDEMWLYSYLYLSDEWLQTLALVLVEFAEDLHNDIGLWRSLEAYQQAFFGTPLPVVVPPGKRWRGKKLMEARLRFLMSVLYPFMQKDMILGPDDEGLPEMSQPVTKFLIEAFAEVPRGSGIKQYLSQPVRHARDVSDRLAWLGQSSYLFRLIFAGNVARDIDGKVEPAAARDFLYTATTVWSGLGVNDILAATLDLTEAQRAGVRSWYEQHLACYLVETVTRGELLLKNLFNEAYYRVELGDTEPRIEAGTMVRGALVPWDGVWHWVAEPEIYREPGRTDFEEIKTALMVEQPELVYLYDPDRLAQDRALLAEHYDHFADHFHEGVVYFSDGEQLAEGMIEYRAQFRQPPDYDKLRYGYMSSVRKGGASIEAMPDRGNDIGYPKFENPATWRDEYGKVDERTDLLPYAHYPSAIENAFGMFFNRQEGIELLHDYNGVEMVMTSLGMLFEDEEREAIRRIVEDKTISPAFIESLIMENGLGSIAGAYGIDNWKTEVSQAFVLRQYKRHFYRRRYPHMRFI
jgi:hypothetical protein